MPNFTYTVKNSSGKTITDTKTAVNREAVITQLQNEGYFIINIAETIASDAPKATSTFTQKKTRRFSRTKITTQDKLMFARQLSAMLESGVNLLRSLTIAVEQVESKDFYNMLSQIRSDVEQGISFSNALAKYPAVFDTLWVSLIEVGEASGTMPVVLNKISSYAEKAEAANSAVISALIYPGILMTVSTIAIGIFALVIGPKFQDMYTSMGAQLPALTQGLLNIFSIIRTYFLLIIGAVFCTVFIIKNYIATPLGRLHFEHILFKIPVVNEMVKVSIMEKFASQMTILIESGVPILYALDIIERLIGNKICEGYIVQIKGRVREGKTISDEMAKTNFFPSMAIQMIAVGEETGELAKMLSHVAEYYEGVLRVATQRFTATFEPVMLVFMGGTIGTIVVAMFLPILNMTKLAGQAAGGG